jgi:hypothetical protein
MTPRDLRRKIRDARRRRRRIVDNEFGGLIVTRTRRAVRLTAIVKRGQLVGRQPATTIGFVDLDDAGIDRLIQRLQSLRGGRRALP